jgi:hypothetical protein
MVDIPTVAIFAGIGTMMVLFYWYEYKPPTPPTPKIQSLTQGLDKAPSGEQAVNPACASATKYLAARGKKLNWNGEQVNELATAYVKHCTGSNATLSYDPTVLPLSYQPAVPSNLGASDGAMQNQIDQDYQKYGQGSSQLNSDCLKGGILLKEWNQQWNTTTTTPGNVLLNVYQSDCSNTPFYDPKIVASIPGQNAQQMSST